MNRHYCCFGKSMVLRVLLRCESLNEYKIVEICTRDGERDE